MKIGHLPWAKKQQASKMIDLQRLFNDYWDSKAQEFTILGQCDPQQVHSHLTDSQRSFSLESIVVL